MAAPISKSFSFSVIGFTSVIVIAVVGAGAGLVDAVAESVLLVLLLVLDGCGRLETGSVLHNENCLKVCRQASLTLMTAVQCVVAVSAADVTQPLVELSS